MNTSGNVVFDSKLEFFIVLAENAITDFIKVQLLRIYFLEKTLIVNCDVH